jgi:hypothetical protein
MFKQPDKKREARRQRNALISRENGRFKRSGKKLSLPKLKFLENKDDDNDEGEGSHE